MNYQATGGLYEKQALLIYKKYPKAIVWTITSLMHSTGYRFQLSQTWYILAKLRYILLAAEHGIPKKQPNFSLVGCIGCRNVRMVKDQHSLQFLVVPVCNKCHGICTVDDYWNISNALIFKDYGGYLNVN